MAKEGLEIDVSVLNNRNNINEHETLSDKYNVDIFSNKNNTKVNDVDYQKTLFTKTEYKNTYSNSKEKLFQTYQVYNETGEQKIINNLENIFYLIIFIQLIIILFIFLRRKFKKGKHANNNN